MFGLKHAHDISSSLVSLSRDHPVDLQFFGVVFLSLSHKFCVHVCVCAFHSNINMLFVCLFVCLPACLLDFVVDSVCLTSFV